MGSQLDERIQSLREWRAAVVEKLEHAVELTRLIPDSRLLILPGGHGEFLGEAVMTQNQTRYPELTARLIEEFLDSP